ncbi:MAG: pentapeptide repeat-containing protein [Clostridiales bacterium]|nr:pentapeptide repeat-containing protein [Clostridiales bacterium]
MDCLWVSRVAATFSATAFSATAFSAATFSATAFSAATFSATVFGATAFSTTTFSTTAFSATTFSATAFSATAFSATAFSAFTVSFTGITLSILSRLRCSRFLRRSYINIIIIVVFGCRGGSRRGRRRRSGRSCRLWSRCRGRLSRSFFGALSGLLGSCGRDLKCRYHIGDIGFLVVIVKGVGANEENAGQSHNADDYCAGCAPCRALLIGRPSCSFYGCCAFIFRFKFCFGFV